MYVGVVGFHVVIVRPFLRIDCSSLVLRLELSRLLYPLSCSERCAVIGPHVPSFVIGAGKSGGGKKFVPGTDACEGQFIVTSGFRFS